MKYKERIARQVQPANDSQQKINRQQAFKNRGHRKFVGEVILFFKGIANTLNIKLRRPDEGRLFSNISLDNGNGIVEGQTH